MYQVLQECNSTDCWNRGGFFALGPNSLISHKILTMSEGKASKLMKIRQGVYPSIQGRVQLSDYVLFPLFPYKSKQDFDLLIKYWEKSVIDIVENAVHSRVKASS